MPCDSVPQGLTAEQRYEQIQEALNGLEQQLVSGQVTMRIAPNGAVVFENWQEGRNGVNDACAYNALSAKGSAALVTAQMMAESLSGYQVNRQAVGGGLHSHDGGHTWGTH